MRPVHHWFVPHKENDHRPYLLRHPALALFLALVLTAETTLNLFYSTEPKVLGFATSVYQQELIALTNQKRQEQGLSMLKHNPILDEAARLKAVDMFANDYWAHVAPDGTTPWHWFKVAGYDYYMAGENLARDFNTSAGVVNAWMASSTHRENILQHDFTEIGLAVVNGILDDEETTLVVQFFGKPAETFSVASALAQEGLEGREGPESAPIITTLPTVAPTATPVTFPESIAANLDNNTTFKPLGLPAQTPHGAQLVTAVQPSSWGLGQQIMLGSLAALMLLFLADSMILWRKGVLRRNSHSLLHAGVLGLLILAVVWSTTGIIL